MADPKTISVYDNKANDYVELVSRETPDQDLTDFMQCLPPNAYVLDFGCGPGNSAAIMAKAGFKVDATDASSVMIELTKENHGVNAKQAHFADLDKQDTYDGIWANFSLLHAPKHEMSDHLGRIFLALKKRGTLHLGLKIGAGESRDTLDRHYSYYTPEEINQLLISAGFTPISLRTGESQGLAGLSGNKEPYMIVRAHA